MQAMLLLALVGVAAGAMSLGGLLNDGEIMLNLQGLGVGDEILSTPVVNPSVDASIEIIPGVDADGNIAFKNKIRSCSFHYSAESDPDEALNGEGAIIICKLLDCTGIPDQGIPGNVVAEGSIVGPFVHSTSYIIPITDFAFEGSNFSTEVCDMQLILIGPPPKPPSPP